MRWDVKARDLPGRMAAGAFILNSGLSKQGADADTAAGLHGMARGTYPFLKRLEPHTFVRLLAAGELALGGALLLPVVPTVVAGAGLTAFSAGLVGMYLRTPGFRREGSIRPTADGTAFAKDVWLLGMGVGFLVDAACSGGRGKARRRRR